MPLNIASSITKPHGSKLEGRIKKSYFFTKYFTFLLSILPLNLIFFKLLSKLKLKFISSFHKLILNSQSLINSKSNFKFFEKFDPNIIFSYIYLYFYISFCFEHFQ